MEVFTISRRLSQPSVVSVVLFLFNDTQSNTILPYNSSSERATMEVKYTIYIKFRYIIYYFSTRGLMLHQQKS